MTNKLLTLSDVAKILCVSERTVRRLRDAGKLPRPIKIGRQLRWRSGDIERYLKRL